MLALQEIAPSDLLLDVIRKREEMQKCWIACCVIIAISTTKKRHSVFLFLSKKKEIIRFLKINVNKTMLGRCVVRTACLESLNGNREGNWDEEVITLLDSNYEDWRDPKGTHMVPCEFSYRTRGPDNGEQTEKKFFDLLQNFGGNRSESMFVIHSYNFAEIISEWNKGSNNETKKWLTGEHDFVVIHRRCGIIFFQKSDANPWLKRLTEL
ncbi:hypothetical protein AWC38_SpisGene10128 [Stylophora pistillata]|uniref:Uncharacterized protein n=1 Tax=Stylophora pistillata TaxID=50429 RepID=A0A2B4S5W5_STYPI|nr:hypothetical protein AWC38_SpisGene10128 [Stylophora pistillata]